MSFPGDKNPSTVFLILIYSISINNIVKEKTIESTNRAYYEEYNKKPPHPPKSIILLL
jgi:hypothetical protein